MKRREWEGPENAEPRGAAGVEAPATGRYQGTASGLIRFEIVEIRSAAYAYAYAYAYVSAP
jgi:hypothetical protein